MFEDLLSKEQIKLDLQGSTKREVLKELVELVAQSGNLTEPKEFHQDILTREKKGSTGMGKGIAIPHARSYAVRETTLVFARSKTGIEFNSLDNQPAKLFFMIAVSKKGSKDHLDILAKLSQQLMHHDFRNQLLQAQNKEEIIEIISGN
ncbi:MAG: PTS sugar transporter subunit IIA [Bacillota bacterium]